MRNRRQLLSLLMFVSFLATRACFAGAAPPQRDTSWDSTLTFQGDTVELTGPITSSLLEGLASLATHFPKVRRLVVNSRGGYYEPAVEIAEIVRAHGWDVVVKDKCLSACADFIFPAGKRKTVLPGAWVGIHEATRIYSRPDGMRLVSGNEIQSDERTYKPTPQEAADFEREKNKASKLYAELGLSSKLLAVYQAYLSNRKRVIGVEDANDFPGTAECPRFKMWALTKEQLESMGVTGIDAFWFPQNAREVESLYKTSELPPGAIYVGEAGQLERYCTGPAAGWLTRTWRELAPKWLRQ